MHYTNIKIYYVMMVLFCLVEFISVFCFLIVCDAGFWTGFSIRITIISTNQYQWVEVPHSIVFAKLFLYVFLHNLVLRGRLRMFEGAGAENIRRHQLYVVGHRHAESRDEFIVKTSHYIKFHPPQGQPTGHFSSIIFFFFQTWRHRGH